MLGGTWLGCKCPAARDTAECDTAGASPHRGANVGRCASSSRSSRRVIRASTPTGLPIPHTATTTVRCACGIRGTRWTVAGCSTMDCWHSWAKLPRTWSKSTYGAPPAAGRAKKCLMLKAPRLRDGELCTVGRWHRYRSVGSHPDRSCRFRLRRAARDMAGCPNRTPRQAASPLRRGLGRRHGVSRVPVHRASSNERQGTQRHITSPLRRSRITQPVCRHPHHRVTARRQGLRTARRTNPCRSGAADRRRVGSAASHSIG